MAVFWCADLYAIPDYLFAGSVQFMLRAEISILIDLLKYIVTFILMKLMINSILIYSIA